jgi:hypothetical protein
VSSDYELESHELLLLENAARTADLVAGLQALIDDEGLVLGVKRILQWPKYGNKGSLWRGCWWR